MNDTQQAYVEAVLATHAAEAKPGESTIEIHGALKRLTAFYERLRTLIDYQDEQFMRRLAIKRILFRALVLQGIKAEIGEQLVRELIRAAYLENGKIPASHAAQIDQILAKYRTGLEALPEHAANGELMRRQRQLLGVAAAEIEDFLSSSEVDRLLVRWLSKEISSYTPDQPNELTRMIAMRTLLKADSDLITWRLFRDLHSKLWQDFTDAPSEHIKPVIDEIHRLENLQESRPFEAKVRRFSRLAAPYLVLLELAREHNHHAKEILEDPVRLQGAIEDTIKDRIKRTEKKVRRTLARATVYIFITKLIFGLPLELMYDLAIHGAPAYGPLIINLALPPILMVLAALSISSPGKDNRELLYERTKAIVLGQDVPPHADIVNERHFSSVTTSVFSFFFVVSYIIAFGALIWFLNLLNFNLASMLVFLFFLSVVGFFAYRIRATARELALVREREGLFFVIFDFFALPFLRLGRWLSLTARQLNVFLFLMDFVLEAPLKVVFVALEDWFAFLREKREELQ